MAGKKPNRKMQAWIDARKGHRLARLGCRWLAGGFVKFIRQLREDD